jgi:hypothetical protein
MIGGLGYFHSQLKATYEIIKNFRFLYPLGSLVMINDAGKEELKSIAGMFQADYHPYTKNLTTGNDVDDIQVMVEWMERFFKAIKLIKEEYCIILEDDVLIIREIDESKIKGDMFGYNPKALLPNKVTEYLKKYNSAIQTDRIWYGGCGGCIIKTETFKKIADEDWKQELLTYAELSKRNSKNEQSWYFNDCCLSFLCWRYGGVIHQNEEWGDCNTAETVQKFKEERLTIAHQYREHFNKPYQNGNIMVL